MASGSAMQQDSLLVGACGDGTSVLLAFAHLTLGVKQQIQWKPMTGELAPEVAQNTHPIVASEPGIRHGDQQIHVGIWAGGAPGAGAEEPHLRFRDGRCDP